MNENLLQYKLAINELKHAHRVLTQKSAATIRDVDEMRELAVDMAKLIETIERGPA